MAVNPAGTRAYVTNFSSNTVSVIDAATNTVVATVPVPANTLKATNLWGVDVNPSGTRAYATQSIGEVSVIDTATNTVVATIPVSIPQSVAFR